MTPPPDEQAPSPAGPWWRRVPPGRWFTIVGVAWLVVVLVSLGFGLAQPTLTDREQSTVASARPVVDEAIARVAAAVTASGTGVVAVSGFERVGACEISVFRDGERYRRAAVVVVPAGTEVDLLRQVAAALPPAYRPVVRAGDTPRLSADAGLWVLLTANVIAPGEVRFLADTGDCRPAGDLDASDPSPTVPADALPAVLQRLSLGGGTLAGASVSCVDGGAIGTVEVRAGAYSGDLREALRDLPGATVVVDEGMLYAYRTATAQVAVRAYPDATVVTATTVCGS